MSHADMSLVYEGPAVDSGAMDVRDLAPALLAFGNLIEATNRVVNGEGASAKVQVKTVGAGSFAIGLDVGVEFLKAARDFLAGPDSTAAANLVGVLTGSAAVGLGALALIRRLRGRSPPQRRAERGKVEIEIDGQKIEIDEVVARVSVDVGVRASLERVVAEPLAKDGIEAVRIGGGEASERIDKPEGYSFRPPIDTEAGAYEYRYRAPFSIVSLSFKAGNKWRLNDGRNTLTATVSDIAFIQRIDRSEVAFSKGDILICDVRVETRERPGGLQSEVFIERIVEPRKPATQASLFDNDETGGGPVKPAAPEGA